MRITVSRHLVLDAGDDGVHFPLDGIDSFGDMNVVVCSISKSLLVVFFLLHMCQKKPILHELVTIGSELFPVDA